MTKMTEMTIVESFESCADADKALKMKHYLRDKFEFLGIPSPERRLLEKDFLKEKSKEKLVDWAFINELWEQEARELQYLAIDYLTKMTKYLTAADLPKIKELVLKKSWWDTVDALDTIAGSIVRADKTAQVQSIMLRWSLDANFWVRRLAIDHQLSFKEGTDTALLSEIIENNLGSDEFFINKAIGWSLRQYSKFNPEWVRNFLKTHENRLDKLSVREASKYL